MSAEYIRPCFAGRDRVVVADLFELTPGQTDRSAKPAKLALDVRILEIDPIKLPFAAVKTDDPADRYAA